jgi:hypothetical protein
MSQGGHFVTIQVRKDGRIVIATLRPPSGLCGHNIPIRFIWKQNVTVDVVNPKTLRWVDVSWVLNFTWTFQACTFSSRHLNIYINMQTWKSREQKVNIFPISVVTNEMSKITYRW